MRALLTRWGLGDLLDPVQLAVSELVTNAVRYGRPPVRLTLRADDETLSAGVHDGGQPLRRGPEHPGHDAESGRGLAILAALGQRTGTRPEVGGKVVWVQFLRGVRSDAGALPRPDRHPTSPSRRVGNG